MKKRKRWLAKGLLLMGVGMCLIGTSAVKVDAKQVGEYKGRPIFDNRFEGIEITEGNEDTSIKRSGASYASKYDPRAKLSKIEDQGMTNTCWAFSTVAAIEANLIKKGYVNKNVNLSENQLAYFFYNRKKDPLGYTAGDSNIALSGDWCMNGGPLQGAALSLMTWSGLVNTTVSEDYTAAEAAATGEEGVKAGMYKPYVPASNLAYKKDYVVKNVHFYNNNRNDIKQAILDYGAVAAGFWADYNEYLSYDTTSYYFPHDPYGSENYPGGGHAIAIIGWDDNYSRKNFNSSCRPSKDGAWIVKNSYGTYFGDDGYIYISYEDASLGQFVSFDVEMATSAEDNNYQHDGSTALTWIKLDNGVTYANVFRAKASGSGYNEVLKAVSVNTYTNNVKYTVKIYTGVTSKSNPTKGKLMLTQNGTWSKAGYNQVVLKTPVTITSGERYSVVVSFSSPSGAVAMGTESYVAGDGIGYDANVAEGASFIKLAKKWYDCGDAEEFGGSVFNVRIKAYTDTTTQKTSYKLSEKTVGLSKGASQKVSLKVTPSAVKRIVTWKSSNKKVATVSSSGKVKGKSYGTATIQATFVAGKSTKTLKCKVTVGPSKLKNLKVSGGKKKLTVKWSKNSQASGYEIRYSKKKTSGYKTLATINSNGKTSYTKKKMSAGTYYVKMRPYVTKNGKKLYGSYTGVKTVKVK